MFRRKISKKCEKWCFHANWNKAVADSYWACCRSGSNQRCKWCALSFVRFGVMIEPSYAELWDEMCLKKIKNIWFDFSAFIKMQYSFSFWWQAWIFILHNARHILVPRQVNWTILLINFSSFRTKRPHNCINFMTFPSYNIAWCLHTYFEHQKYSVSLAYFITFGKFVSFSSVSPLDHLLRSALNLPSHANSYCSILPGWCYQIYLLSSADATQHSSPPSHHFSFSPKISTLLRSNHYTTHAPSR